MISFIRIAFTLLSFSLVYQGFGYTASDDLSAVVLDKATKIKLDGKKLIEETSVHIEINKKSAQHIGRVQIPYEKGDKLKIVEAVIMDSSGNILRKLSKKDIVDRSSIADFALYEDDFVKSFQLVWNTFPYQIKYSFKKTSKRFLSLAHWVPVSAVDMLVQNAELHVDVPMDMPIKIKASESFEHSETKIDGRVLHQWNISGYRLHAHESYAPPFSELIAKVIVLPEQFDYGVPGSFASWQSFGDWQYDLNQGLDILPEDEILKVKKLTKDAVSDRERIDILYRYMQDNTRYIYTAENVGGLKPYPSSYVCDKKYGDCKALTIYMKSMLAAIDIPSHYVKVFAGSNPSRVDETFPSPSSNHVILAVPLGQDTIWLENTNAYSPSGYLGDFTQNRRGFWIDQGKSKLIDLPAMTLDDVHSVTEYDIELTLEGPSSVKLMLTGKGDDFDALLGLEESGRSKSLEKYLNRKVGYKKAKLIDWEFQPSEEPLSKIVKLNAQSSKVTKKIADRMALYSPKMRIPEVEKTDKRMYDIRVVLPIYQEYQVSYDASAMSDWMIELPADVLIESPYGKYEVSYAQEEGQIKVNKIFQLFTGDYLKDEYGEFKSFLDDARHAERRSNMLMHQ